MDSLWTNLPTLPQTLPTVTPTDDRFEEEARDLTRLAGHLAKSISKAHALTSKSRCGKSPWPIPSGMVLARQKAKNPPFMCMTPQGSYRPQCRNRFDQLKAYQNCASSLDSAWRHRAACQTLPIRANERAMTSLRLTCALVISTSRDGRPMAKTLPKCTTPNKVSSPQMEYIAIRETQSSIELTDLQHSGEKLWC